ncbi:hypothetical protein AJ79_07887 [Helicocarpus griseus UAMH5409]|uniref:ORP1 like protein n=1 Tax=Helicocarpus griseus UAMH5409 TaxID=1447875 RepID=A0A2B7WY59_9EURO|nr:hypothetical protein AJ79_07887 [Helicocarpus griseus UAMH5409]
MATSSSGPAKAQTPCQFSGEACSTESRHYRKVISHIFGRNKKCTVGIPECVWIYYCRKHYQRARYRTAEWPFRQCDLAVDTIENMRAWGGVESFNLQLRRRETQRATGLTKIDDGIKVRKEKNRDKDRDMSHVKSEGRELSQPSPGTRAGAFTPINAGSLAVPSKMDESDYEPGDDGEKIPADNAPSEVKKKRSPTIVPHPVPNWLYSRVGKNKTFDEILEVLHELRRHLTAIAQQEEIPHFPDIEILPNLRPRAAAPRRNVRRATRPTTRPSRQLSSTPTLTATTTTVPVAVPADAVTSNSTQTKRPATRSPSPRLADPGEAPIDQPALQTTNPLSPTARVATHPSIRPPAGPGSVNSSPSHGDDDDASNASINYAILQAARAAISAQDRKRRYSRVSKRGGVKKTEKG